MARLALEGMLRGLVTEKEASRRKKPRHAGIFPLNIQMAPETGGVDNIPRPIAHDLVGDAIVADNNELGFGLDQVAPLFWWEMGATTSGTNLALSIGSAQPPTLDE